MMNDKPRYLTSIGMPTEHFFISRFPFGQIGMPSPFFLMLTLVVTVGVLKAPQLVLIVGIMIILVISMRILSPFVKRTVYHYHQSQTILYLSSH